MSIIKQFENHLAYWASLPAGSAAAAINHGIDNCKAEIVVWTSCDLFADGALEAVGWTFSRHPNVDVVFGNALLINARDEAFRSSLERLRTSYISGSLEVLDRIRDLSVLSAPLPTIFVRKDVFRSYGALDENYDHLYGPELLHRIGTEVRVQKIERVITLNRVDEMRRVRRSRKGPRARQSFER